MLGPAVLAGFQASLRAVKSEAVYGAVYRSLRKGERYSDDEVWVGEEMQGMAS